MRSILRAVVCGALVLGFAVPALASGKARKKIEEYTIAAQRLETGDAGKVATGEIGTLRAWLNEANAYLAQDDDELLDQALDRVTVQVALIEAMLARHKAEEAANAVHEQADAQEKEMLKARNRAAELERRQAELEKKGGG